MTDAQQTLKYDFSLSVLQTARGLRHHVPSHISRRYHGIAVPIPNNPYSILDHLT